ncbi:NELL2-interacting cell ontogeny regulator 1-like [Anomaloglossus baeobatrachus]|uniref:NELL2-interacting cell ontogeny regulator 1-like n=1 Tax=Anomaloglossus baeobatrachus TaxID=238106 RepID=UPI003F5067C5
MMLQFAVRPVIWWIMVVVMVGGKSPATPMNEMIVGVNFDTGNVISADTRLCVDCQSFKFLEQAVQDLYRAADNLDSQTEALFLRTEDCGLCTCRAS